MSFHRLDLANQKIDSLEGLDTIGGLNFVVIDLKDNYLRNFQSFGTHASLVELDVRRNRIDSLFGLTRQQSLEIIRIDGNPIADHPLYRIMVLQTIGYTLRIIDSKAVTSTEVSLAKRLGGQAALAVSCGWILDLVPRSQHEYRRIIEERRKQRHSEISESSTNPLISALHKVSTLSSSAEKIVFPESVKLNSSNSLNTVKDRNIIPEIVYASQVEFDEGISVSTNLHEEQSLLGVLRFSGPFLCFQDFLRRKTIIKLDVRRTKIVSPLKDTLIFSSPFGVEVKVTFTSLEVLEAVRRTLVSRQSANLERLWGTAAVGSEESPLLVKSPENRVDAAVDENIFQASSRDTSVIGKENTARSQNSCYHPQSSKRSSVSRRSDTNVRDSATQRKVDASSSPDTKGIDPTSTTRRSSGAHTNAPSLVDSIENTVHPASFKEPSVNHGVESLNGVNKSHNSSKHSRNASSHTLEVPPDRLKSVDLELESVQDSPVLTKGDSASEERPLREEIEIEANKDSEELMNETLGDDGGVQTPPPETVPKPAAISKFQNFIIDSDSDSD